MSTRNMISGAVLSTSSPFGHRCRFERRDLGPGSWTNRQGGEAVPKRCAATLDLHQVRFEGLTLKHLASVVFACIRYGDGLPGDLKREQFSLRTRCLIAAGILAGSRRLVRRVDPGYHLKSGTTAELIPENGCLFGQAGASWKHIKTRRWRALTNLPLAARWSPG